jgi:hypothetical protein
MTPRIIRARNVNHAFHEAWWWLKVAGETATSRNGEVIRAPGPVITMYERPTERVLFNPLRNANPFFHLMEALWMLAGRNDVEFPAYYVARMKDYSDNGVLLHGAYGFRWRNAFLDPDEAEPIDQLSYLADHLRNNPESRRAVLAMWSAEHDMPVLEQTRDLPCNTHVYFQIREGALNMTVLCRSNDLLWGAYGTNAVHFSVMQEYMAAQIGCKPGIYTQFSNDFHLYTNIAKLDDPMFMEQVETHLYDYGQVQPYPLIRDPRQWDSDLHLFMRGVEGATIKEPFFNEVAWPMHHSYRLFKDGQLAAAKVETARIQASDWRRACLKWLERKENAK